MYSVLGGQIGVTMGRPTWRADLTFLEPKIINPKFLFLSFEAHIKKMPYTYNYIYIKGQNYEL